MIQHRFKATSHAAVAGTLLLGFFCMRHYLREGKLPLDLIIVLGGMAVTKLAAMVYYRITD